MFWWILFQYRSIWFLSIWLRKIEELCVECNVYVLFLTPTSTSSTKTIQKYTIFEKNIERLPYAKSDFNLLYRAGATHDFFWIRTYIVRFGPRKQ